MRSTGEGPGSADRLLSKRVKPLLRRLEMTSQPSAVRASSVAASSPPAASRARRRCSWAVDGTATWRSPADRKSVVSGKSVSVRVDLGGRRIIKKKKKQHIYNESQSTTT